MSSSLQLYTAMSGSRFTKIPNAYAPIGVPTIPYTVNEALVDAKECYKLGVRLMHVHSRGNLGEHVMDPEWYYEFGNQIRSQCPEVKLCFASSRAGQVAETIRNRQQQLLKLGYSKEEATVKAEFERVGYLETKDASLYPEYITAFTATEVKMLDNNLETGHVSETQSPHETRQFFENLLTYTNSLRVKQEIEITTANSLDILDKFELKAQWNKQPSVVFLPGFTRSFPFSPTILNHLLPRARQWLDRMGGGLITLGRIISAGEDSILARQEHVEYAINNPYVDAIRIGIEDSPFYGSHVLSNPEIVKNTVQLIEQLGGKIALSTK